MVDRPSIPWNWEDARPFIEGEFADVRSEIADVKSEILSEVQGIHDDVRKLHAANQDALDKYAVQVQFNGLQTKHLQQMWKETEARERENNFNIKDILRITNREDRWRNLFRGLIVGLSTIGILVALVLIGKLP